MTLDQIRARANAASPGPWRIDNDSECDYEQGIPYAEWPQTLVGLHQTHPTQWAKDRGEACNIDEISELTFPDAEFIAHARQDVPTLLAAVDAILALHERVEIPEHGDLVVCGYCEMRYPCQTRTAITEPLEGTR